MVFVDYEIAKLKYLETQGIYDQVITEKEELFSRTQPKGTSFDKELVSSANFGNNFDQYLIEKEKKQIDAKLMEAKELLNERGNLLNVKEKELRASKALYDRIYTMRYIDNVRVMVIARKMSYSESQIYRILDRIEKMRENARKLMII